MNEALAAALDAVFSDRNIVDVSEPGPSWNELNQTVQIICGSGETYYLKIAADGDGTRIRRERGVITFLQSLDAVPVPDIFVADPSHEIPHLVTERMPGRPLIGAEGDADPETRLRFVRLIGRALARVHANRFDHHGHIVDGDQNGLELDTGPWSEILVDRVEFMRELGPSDRFDHHFDSVIDTIRRHADRLDDAPATLVHGDPAKPNCMLHQDGISLLDWEISHVGDPARELRRARRQLFAPVRKNMPKHVVDALHDGYREVAGTLPRGFHDRRPIYSAITFLGVSGFFEKYVEYGDETENEFADWVSREMDCRLDAIASNEPA